MTVRLIDEPVDLVDCYGLEHHPAAGLFPLMGEVEIAELAVDIQEHGLRQPIVLLESKVLDGRNRLAACELADFVPTFTKFDGDDPIAFVVSANLKRRHLDASQRAMIADRIARMHAENPGANLRQARADAGSAMNVSERSIDHASRVNEHGSSWLIKAVDAGQVAVSTASDLTELPRREQAQVVARGEKAILEEAKKIRQRERAQRIPNDAYYTPDDVALACVRTITPKAKRPAVLEPSVGGGAFARAVRAEWNARVTGIDLVEEVPGFADCDEHEVCDFSHFVPIDEEPDWIVGNVPYNQAEAHVRAALELTPTEGVAFLLRLGFLESEERESFWIEHPPAEVLVLTNRPSFTGGSTDATAYGWFIWRTGFKGTPTLGWIR